MEELLLERRLIYVTGKGGVGKTTVAASLGIAAAEAGRRTIVCEVAEQDRVSRALGREGVATGGRDAARRPPVGDHDRPAARARGVARAPARRRRRCRLLARSSAFQYFVAAAPGAKELITIAKVWELAQLERWDHHNRTYDLVIVDAPASGHGLAMLTHPADVRRDRARRPDPPPGVEDHATAWATDAHRATSPSRCPRRCRSTRRSTSSAGSRTRSASGSTRSWSTACGRSASAPPRRRSCGARASTAAARRRAPPLRAALTTHERARAQRTHLRRLRREAERPGRHAAVRVRDRAGAAGVRAPRRGSRAAALALLGDPEPVEQRLVAAPGAAHPDGEVQVHVLGRARARARGGRRCRST